MLTKAISSPHRMIRIKSSGYMPRDYSYSQLANITRYPDLIIKDLSKSRFSKVYHIEGNYIVKLLNPENRGLYPDALRIYDLQSRLKDNPHIERIHYAAIAGERQILVTGFENLKPLEELTPEILSSLLDTMCDMDIKGVLHCDYGAGNIWLKSKDNLPFLIDFEKAQRVLWYAANIPPETIASFFEESSSTIRAEVFNIDTFQNYLLIDKLMDMQDKGREAAARGVFSYFLKESVPYFERIHQSFSRNKLIPRIYLRAMEARLKRLNTINASVDQQAILYDKKMLDNMFIAYRWAKSQVQEHGRSELQKYLEQCRARLQSWLSAHEGL